MNDFASAPFYSSAANSERPIATSPFEFTYRNLRLGAYICRSLKAMVLELSTAVVRSSASTTALRGVSNRPQKRTSLDMGTIKSVSFRANPGEMSGPWASGSENVSAAGKSPQMKGPVEAFATSMIHLRSNSVRRILSNTLNSRAMRNSRLTLTSYLVSS